MNKQIYKRGAALILLLLLVSPAMAGTSNITIFGTNASNAQANITKDGNQSVNVTAWNIGGNGIKSFYINVTNSSDILTISVSNFSANQILELRVNGISINGYQANASGTVAFVRNQSRSNYSFDIRPAMVQGGYNNTWSYIKYLYVITTATIGDMTNFGKAIVSPTPLSEGDTYYNSSRHVWCYYNGTGWNSTSDLINNC